MSKYPPHSGTLSKLNQNFHDNYEELVQQTLKKLGRDGIPVIITKGDHVFLLHKGERLEAQIIPEIYHKLKAISHVPLGLYTLLTAWQMQSVDGASLDGLEMKRNLVQEALDALETEGFPPELKKKQVLILKSCLRVIDTVLKTKGVDQTTLNAYTQVVAPLLMDNADLAVRLHLEKLHETVTAWRAKMDEAELRSLYVIVCAGHQARAGEASKQYFDRMLGERKSSGAEYEERVIYAEALKEEATVLDLLARHIIDQRASASFFRSRFHLQQDLLADSASRYLDDLLASG